MPDEHHGLDHAVVVLTSREAMQTRLCELHCYCGMMCWLVHGFAEPLRSESRTPVRVMAGFSFKPTVKPTVKHLPSLPRRPQGYSWRQPGALRRNPQGPMPDPACLRFQHDCGAGCRGLPL